MNKAVSLALVLVFLLSGVVLGEDKGIKTYVKKDGSVVCSHIRSEADKYKFNNLNTKGRGNPYKVQDK